MKSISPTFIIIGITGDLAEKKLLPALYGLAKRGLLDDETRIIGTSRKPITNEDIIGKLFKDKGDETVTWLDAHLTTLTADPGTADGAKALAEYLKESDAMHLFYLSIPPATFPDVIRSMGNAGLNGNRDYLMVEKPFGRDAKTARELHELTDANFNEANIYRVDHYLAKPGVRNVTESGRLILDPRNIQSIDIRSDEALDIEGRVDFYEQTGALRDVIQSHLLQVLAVCMTAYHAHDTSGHHGDARADALSSLETLSAYRAQYNGYRDETKNPDSVVETYAALELTSGHHDWRAVRITVRSGKALPKKESDITVTFIDGTTQVFDMNANPANLLDGYEQVLYDAGIGDRSLFLSARDVDESWRIVDGTLSSWADKTDGLEYYKKGTIPKTEI